MCGFRKRILLIVLIFSGVVVLESNTHAQLKDKFISVNKKIKITNRSSLRSWDIKEEYKKIDRNKKFSKRSSEGLYNKKIKIFDKGTNVEKLTLEYIADKSNDEIIFSPNEDVMFYIGFDEKGESSIYGVNLYSKQKFKVDSGNNMDIANCWNNKTYLIIKDNTNRKDIIYYFYDIKGKRTAVISKSMIVGDVDDYVCY